MSFRPRALTHLLEAPVDYRGSFGWMCGFTADAHFLNEAATRFTGQTTATRRQQGEIKIALMLDAHHAQIPITQVPGVFHLPVRRGAMLPFRLLHAKVALLGFQHCEDSARWKLRLVVSTGNWTRQTLQDSLDLAWCAEVGSAELSGRQDAVRVACADVLAAQELLVWLRGFFDERLLRQPGAQRSTGLLEAWTETCRPVARGRDTRFFDNRDRSMLDSLVPRAKAQAGDSRRNRLAMGSGFFERFASGQQAVTVPGRIRQRLLDKQLLTASASTDLFVNPEACQSVSQSLEALVEQGITVRASRPPKFLRRYGEQRFLHAKFIFSASWRAGSPDCLHPWVYLGSGNLTQPGFCFPARAAVGNLEVGVLFAPGPLRWKDTSGVDPAEVVTQLLPIQWDEELDNADLLQPGDPPPPREPSFAAPPVSAFSWQPVGDEGLLVPLDVDADAGPYQVLDAQEMPCSSGIMGWKWPGNRPRAVTMRWGADGAQCALVPVCDVFGRVAATDLDTLSLADAIAQLGAFPAVPAADEDGDEDGDGDGDDDDSDDPDAGAGKTRAVAATGRVAAYPIRQMMEFVETIARRQAALSELDWPTWCVRLEQTLAQIKDSVEVQVFRDMGLNPLAPLRQACFRPEHAETGDSESSRLYEATLDRVEQRWQVKGLDPLGKHS